MRAGFLQRDMQAAILQPHGAADLPEAFEGSREGWDEMGFAALFQEDDGASWQPAVQHAATDKLIVVSFDPAKYSLTAKVWLNCPPMHRQSYSDQPVFALALFAITQHSNAGGALTVVYLIASCPSQDPSPFVERLNIGAAELDPQSLGVSSDSLFGSSGDPDSSETQMTGMVGSVLSKVGSKTSAPGTAYVPQLSDL